MRCAMCDSPLSTSNANSIKSNPTESIFDTSEDLLSLPKRKILFAIENSKNLYNSDAVRYILTNFETLSDSNIEVGFVFYYQSVRVITCRGGVVSVSVVGDPEEVEIPVPEGDMFC